MQIAKHFHLIGIMAFVLMVCFHVFSHNGFANESIPHSSPYVYKSIEGQKRLVDVLGWKEMRWDMNRQNLIKTFGNKLKPNAYDYVISNVKFGSLETDLKVFMFHISEDGMDDLITTYYAHSVEAFNKQRTVELLNYFSQMYGQPEVLSDCIYSNIPKVYKTEVKWSFPTTTISLTVEQKEDEKETIVFIQFDEVISEKHSITISKDMLDNMDSKLVVIRWNKMPVFILKRNKRDVDFINSGVADQHLADPMSYKEPYYLQKQSRYPLDFTSAFVQEPFRSIKKEIALFIASGPISGCIPVLFAKETRSNKHHMREKDALASQKWGKAWMNGFYDPCSDDYFDMSGRVYKGDNYGANMAIPKHRYDHDGNLIIGY